MNIKFSSFLVVAAAVALFASTSTTTGGVEAAVFRSGTVECLPEQSSTICVGEASFTSPSPAMMCNDPTDPNNCISSYFGGYSWTYEFVTGLGNGTDIIDLDPDVMAKAKTGLVVTVKIDDDSVCSIDVGNNETCTACSDVNCGEDATEIAFDCTNVQNGRASTGCEPLEKIFYPFMMDDTSDSILEENNDETTSVDGIDVGADDTSSSSSSSSSFSSSSSSAAMSVVGFGTLFVNFFL